MQYHFNDIEAKWQKYWSDNQTFKASNHSDKPKYYVLDMFPYPSGAGLHVGHPLGYIASDIVARYKRHKGFNVLHPQGYDSFGLPAEQYAIQTGQHPAITTEENIKTYRRQLDQIGFSFDWSREVRTSDPNYYKWTQWIFIQLFESWYNNHSNKAEHIDTLIEKFEADGNANVNAVCDDAIEAFSATDWKSYSIEKQQEILLKYRLTYLAETEVNWCPALGTVLANDEIVNGVSERGGHPVIRKKMTQWSMRISAYAERLLQGLDTIDWTESLKESQRNWIGKSVGASVSFKVKSDVTSSAVETSHIIEVFTTRPDTIFGVSFMTLAPEHDLVSQITTPEQKAEVDAYIEATAKRSERDRMADVKTISGAFTGAYAEHPFTKKPIPIWIGDYVLAGYGTGAVMSVPCGDERDYAFAKHFGIEIPNIFEGVDISQEAFSDKDQTIISNSDFLNGLNYKEATKKAIAELEKLGQGQGKTNYRLRDAVFSRQRYWGEPFPVYYVNGMPQMIDKAYLPIRLPEVEKYLPTETGEPPLGRADVWAWDTKTNTVVSSSAVENKTVFPLELNTMPGWAGSSWYWMRYMDAHNDNAFASAEALNYWENVDLYIGGSEHATGHLLYARFWNKFLKDRGFAPTEEPFKKLINQGMILGTSALVYRVDFSKHWDTTLKDFKEPVLSKPLYISYSIYKKFEDLYSFILKSNLSDKDKHELVKGNGFTKGLASVIQDTVFYEILDDEQKNVLDNYRSIFEHVFNDVLAQKTGVIVTGLDFNPIHIKVQYINASDELDIEALRKDKEFGKEYENAIFISENGKVLSFGEDLGEAFKVGREVEKMSKRWLNVVNPEDICKQYGADSLRLYEMFLGPLEQYKPWNTAGITGVHGFLKKLWKLYVGENGLNVNDAEPSKEALKTLHKTIKKVEEDIENFSFNTSVSTFMIAVNELSAQKCTSREVLEPLLILLSPYAPHIAEFLYACIKFNKIIEVENLPKDYNGISTAAFPKYDERYLVESTKNYPISFNGKMKFTLELPMDLSKDDIEKAVMTHEKTIAQLEGRTPKNIIIVPGKIVNIVG